MPRHPDFEVLFQKFVTDYGTEQGKEIYFAYLHNQGLNEENPMPSKQDNLCFCENCVDSHTQNTQGNLFSKQDINRFPNILKQEKESINFLSDAIENNYKNVQKSLDNLFENEKDKYKLIIEKNIPIIYDLGIQESAQELSLDPAEFGDLKNRKNQMSILQQNTLQLAFNLLDDIQKEITLIITNSNLNNIPMTNVQLKSEISDVFNKKIDRLDSQVVSETDRSFNVALEYGYKQSGLVVSKQWVAVIDNVTSITCLTLNGEIAEIGKPFSLGFYNPPAHPNCRSRIVGITLSEYDMLKSNDSIKIQDLPRIKKLIDSGYFKNVVFS
jgi:SPP1 gp7 family putative phage head morphogenesis protein